MNFNCNQKEIKQEVCNPKKGKTIKQTNLCDRYVLLESPKGKVTYKVSKQISDVFESRNYQGFFRLLGLIENQLDEHLSFTVELDYITLEAFKRCCEQDKRGYINLKNRIGTRIFELLNDLSIRKTSISSEEILDKYLCNSDLDALKEYYEKYHDIVMDCFSKDYSTLCLYDIIYNGSTTAQFLDKLHVSIKDEDECIIKKDFACRLMIEYLTEMSAHASEKTREELSYQMSVINKNFDNLDCHTLSTISNEMRLIIDRVYNLI
ncbi:MAG: hypothetical protein J6A15_06895 [Clostridia bacterium]|nr:hypothetical protein [Clostridia bacterium]